MTRDAWAKRGLAIKNSHLDPADTQELALPALTDDQILRGLNIDLDARPRAAMDDDIQAYASCVGQMLKAMREPGDGE